MAKQKTTRIRSVATAEELAALHFKKVDFDLDSLPTNDAYLSLQTKRIQLIRMAAVLLRQGEAEMAETVRQNPDMWLDLVEQITPAREAFEQDAKILAAAESRLLICMSRIEIEMRGGDAHG